MEQEKQLQKEKKDIVSYRFICVTLCVSLLISFLLCIRIGLLEAETDDLQKKIDEVRIALETGGKENVSHTEAEPQTGAGTDLQESTIGNGSAEVENAVNTELVEENIKHKVYLTFDDGPSANTEAILEILDAYNVKATFFVLGKEDSVSKERLQMIYEKGHTIGMHSYSHVYSDIYFSLDNFKEDFWKSKQYLLDTIGADCLYYRFPGGSSNTAANMNMQECVDFLKEQGVEYYDWNIISGDGSSRKIPKETIIKNCTDSIKNYGTSIILLHDASSKMETVEALPEIIEAILAIEGAVILPISEETKPIHHVINNASQSGPIPGRGEEQEEDVQEGIGEDVNNGSNQEQEEPQESEPENASESISGFEENDSLE